MASGTCTTIANLLISSYGLSLFQSNMTNFIFFIMYVPANFLAIAVLKKWGMKVCIVLGTLFLLLGSWIRLFVLFSDKNFVPYFIGATIAAIG